jgi:DMSO/TMAO reductase YedYZ molybdopterin-dependent catalytic subunit
MTAITRNGSYQNSYGNVRGVGVYTGVLISDLVELVGGMLEDHRVQLTAADGYNQTFEYSKVYPNTTIWDIQGDMILAYEYNGTTMPEYERGFQLMFLPEDEYYSNADANATTDPDPYGAGPQLVSNVVEIRVLPEPIALVVDVEGEVEEFTLADIMEMASVSGEGGYKRNSGTISGPYNFAGVSVLSLIEQITTLPSNYTLTAYSSDGWSSQYTKAVVEGTVNGYTPAGDPLDVIHSTMVLAYEMDGSPVGEEDGPLRIVFLNEDGNLTDGYRWARQVVNLTISEVPLSGLVLEDNNVLIRSDSLVEMQLCGQSNLFTCIFMRRF